VRFIDKYSVKKFIKIREFVAKKKSQTPISKIGIWDFKILVFQKNYGLRIKTDGELLSQIL